MLPIERAQGEGINEFFQNRRQHHQAKADRIASDDQECELPGKASAEESVVEAGMRDRRRILAADGVEHEVERSEDEQTPDERNVESDFSEFHLREIVKESGAAERRRQSGNFG